MPCRETFVQSSLGFKFGFYILFLCIKPKAQLYIFIFIIEKVTWSNKSFSCIYSTRASKIICAFRFSELEFILKKSGWLILVIGHSHPLAPISFQDILFCFSSAVRNREGALPLRSYAYCCQIEVRSLGNLGSEE